MLNRVQKREIVYKVSSIMLVLLLSGCAGNQYRLYEGPELAPDKVARLEVPLAVDLLELNGKNLTGLGIFLKNQDTSVSIKPGHQSLLVQYEEVWELSADQHEIISSTPLLFNFATKAGDQWTFVYTAPKDPTSARRFANQPDIRLVNNLTGEAILGQAQANPETLTLTPIKRRPPPQHQSLQQSNLEMLKLWWKKADIQERQDFQRWLEQPSESSHSQ